MSNLYQTTKYYCKKLQHSTYFVAIFSFIWQTITNQDSTPEIPAESLHSPGWVLLRVMMMNLPVSSKL